MNKLEYASMLNLAIPLLSQRQLDKLSDNEREKVSVDHSLNEVYNSNSKK